MTVLGPPLGLSVEVADVDGSNATRWSSHARNAGDRPTGITFSTKRGDGFSDASCTLSRRIDGEYVDLGLLKNLTLVGEDGSVAYEGRVNALPRSMDDQHSISVQAAGWMAHAKDRQFREIYVDSQLSRWAQDGGARALSWFTANYNLSPGTISQGVDAQIVTTLPGGATTASAKPASEVVYDSLGIPIGAIVYGWQTLGATDPSNANFTYQVILAPQDDAAPVRDSVELRAAGVTSGYTSLLATTQDRIFAFLKINYTAAFPTANACSIQWTKLQVVGNAGLQNYYTPEGLQGYLVSDMIRDSCRRFAPLLNTGGVQDTTYPVAQAAFFDPIFPYDLWTQLNAYHRWGLSVWENRTLTYAPVDLSDYDWEIRLGDPGVQVQWQGDSTADLANGIAVNYTDVATGRAQRIEPSVYPDLRDSSVENPANQAGLPLWTELTLSFPVTLDGALQLGRAALAESNSPKAPGTFRVQGHIRDRAGHLQPAWKVRADDRISITNFVNDRPRLIVETGYDHDSQTVSISVDAPSTILEAVFDRITNALSAANLS